MQKKVIGILAGQGDLPEKIIRQCCEQEYPFFLIAFNGQTDPLLIQHHSHAWVSLGAAGKILGILKENHVTHVVLAGSLRRPSWAELKLDWIGTQWLAKMGLKTLGDDGLLSSVTSLLQAQGFTVLSAADLLSDLLTPEGVMGICQPDEEDWRDIARGKQILHMLGSSDVGQAVIVQQDLVLGIEAIEGTEELLNRCASLRRDGRGGVLVKLAKPGQSRVADLPTIGLKTIQQAEAAGLRGIAVGAGSTQILDRQAAIKAADAANLYLIGIPVP